MTLKDVDVGLVMQFVWATIFVFELVYLFIFIIKIEFFFH